MESAGGNLNGEQIWAAILDHLSSNKPIAAEYAQKAVFAEDDGMYFTVAISPEETIARESLLRERTRGPIEELLTSMSNAPRKLKIELREGVRPTIIPAEMPEEDEPKNQPQESSPVQENTSNNIQPEPAEDDVYNDPLIKEALEIFEAEIKND